MRARSRGRRELVRRSRRAARRQRAARPCRPGGRASRARARPCAPPLRARACGRRAREAPRSEDRRARAPRSSAVDRPSPAMRVEGEVERRVGDGEARQHLGAEEARVQAPEPADRAEPVTGPAGRGDRSRPVRSDAELVRGERVRLLARDERHRVVGDLREQPVELRDGLALREPTDVDTRRRALRRRARATSRRTRARAARRRRRRAPRRTRASRAGNGCARDDEHAERSEASRRAPDAGF